MSSECYSHGDFSARRSPRRQKLVYLVRRNRAPTYPRGSWSFFAGPPAAASASAEAKDEHREKNQEARAQTALSIHDVFRQRGYVYFYKIYFKIDL